MTGDVIDCAVCGACAIFVFKNVGEHAVGPCAIVASCPASVYACVYGHCDLRSVLTIFARLAWVRVCSLRVVQSGLGGLLNTLCYE